MFNLTKRDSAAATLSAEPAAGAGHRIDCDLTTRAYRLNLDSIDLDGRSIEAVIATAARCMVVDWERWEVIEEILVMKGVRVPANGQVPLVDTHDRSTIQKMAGSARDIRVDGDKLIARNFYSSSSVAEHAWTLTREGHLTDNSIGYRVSNSVMIPKGERAKVGGVEYEAGPMHNLRISLEWEVRENSLCPIGADQAAKHRQDASLENRNLKNRKGSTMNKFDSWLLKRGIAKAAYDKLGEQERTTLRADFDAEVARAAEEAAELQRTQEAEAEAKRTAAATATATAVADIAAVTTQVETALAKERERSAAIRTECGDDMDSAVVDKFIADGTSVDEVRAAVLTHIRTARTANVNAPAIIIGSGDFDRTLLVDAMCLRAGYEDIILGETGGEERAGRAERYRDLNTVDLCRMAIQLDGGSIPTSRDEMLRAAFSTASLPAILGALVNKSALKGYNAAPATWKEWCNIGSVPDFKTVTRARLTDTGDLLEVGNSGEIKHGGATDEKEQFNIATFAKLMSITRTNIINDDMGAFTKTPNRLGVRAMMLIAKLVYTHLMANGNMDDSIALFHASHSNLLTSAALAEATLTAALAAFEKQTDKDGQPIDVAPAYILVPSDLHGTAKGLLLSDFMLMAQAGTTDANVTKGNANVNKGALKIVSESRLGNASYTGYSATSWYVTGDPKVCDTVEVAFLNGKQEPTIERLQPPANVLGLQYRVYHDVGVKSLDARTVQKSTA